MANRNLRARIGHGAYKVIRVAAKIPHLNAATQEGIYIDRLARELGVENYTAMCAADNADVVLETIYYCQTELSSVGETLSKSRIRLNPDFDRNEEVSPAATIYHSNIFLTVVHACPCVNNISLIV